MVGCHHRLNGHEFEQAPGDGDGEGSLACCSPWGHKELDTTERLNRTEHITAEPIQETLTECLSCAQLYSRCRGDGERVIRGRLFYF